MVLIPYFLMAQQPTINVKLPEILPPSPNAAELGKYGGIDVGMHTGTMNYKIPLYALAFGKSQLPIELQYSTTGIKVDQISSRVGMGWSLNSGGVITRSVNGRVDERATRTDIPANWQALDQSLLSFLENYMSSQHVDAEPDEFFFNFNGYTGKFVLNSTNKPVLLQPTNLKIEFLPISTEISKFVITTPDGYKYTFADVELTSTNSYCFTGIPHGSVASRVPTAWYLSTIHQSNGDSVVFQYDDLFFEYSAGANQVLTMPFQYIYNSGICNPPSSPPSNNNTFCYTAIISWAKVLKSISYKSSVISFQYSNRLDIVSPDPRYLGEQLLTSISVSENSKFLRQIDFNYVYSVADNSLEHIYFKHDILRRRPFLMSVNEKSSILQNERTHTFVYDDMNSMPQRLSLSQDIYGYFNRQQNTNLIPVPDSDFDKQLFADANANRNVDLVGTRKGSLVKINYPTGGSDSLVYALNTYLKSITQAAPTQTKSLSITPQATINIVRTTTPFSDAYNNGPDIKISAGTIVAVGSDGSSSVDPSLDLMEVSLIRQTDNAIMFSKTLKLSEALQNYQVIGLVKGEQYFLKIESLYPNVRCTGSVIYPTGLPTQVLTNINTGGLRVEKVITKDELGRALIKKYYYAALNNLNQSSGKIALQPILIRTMHNEYKVDCPDSGGGLPNQFYIEHEIRSAHSNSLVNVYLYSQNNVVYESVVESIGGDNFENGGILHKYLVQRDAFSKPLLGQDLILGLKTSNTGWLNGFESYTLYFKKSGENIINQKEIVNHYKIDESVNDEVKAYLIAKNYDSPYTTIYRKLLGYEIHEYKFNSKWVYLDTTSTTIYDLNGNNPVEQKSIYKYQNPLHFQLSALETKGSDGVVIQKSYAYPHEMVSSGKDQTGVYQKMILKNILSPLIEEISYKNGSTFNVKANYYETLQGLYLPKSVQTQKGTDNVETRIVYNDYDDTGNPLSVAMEKGPGICYVWGYGKRYVIAEIKNADYSIVETVLGGKNTVDQFANNLNPTNEVVNTFLASLRTDTRLKDAQVVTYTYEPLVGITSATDFRKQTTYYEYDDFQRLKYIKDADGNILKEHTYNYKQ